jgi:hypothetical protein
MSNTGFWARVICAGVFVCLFASCTMTIGRADRDATLISSDETYYVIGVHPDIASIGVNRGSISGDKFVPDQLSLSQNFFGPPEDGYIVSRAHAGETLAIIFASIRRKDALLASNFVPCDDTRTLAFAVPAGKVIYVGDVYFTQTSDQLPVSYSKNFDAAKAYMTTHYPRLADKLEQGNAEMVPAVVQGCRRW